MAGGVPRPSGKTAPAEKPGEGGWVAGPSAILRRTKDCTNERRQDYTVCRLGKSRSASIPLAEIGGQALPTLRRFRSTAWPADDCRRLAPTTATDCGENSLGPTIPWTRLARLTMPAPRHRNLPPRYRDLD